MFLSMVGLLGCAMVVGVFVRTQHRRGETASVLTDDSAAKYGAIPPQVTPRTEGDTSGL